MSYDLRRLRLRGLIERIPYTHRYRVTDDGMRVALLRPRSLCGSHTTHSVSMVPLRLRGAVQERLS